MTINNPFSKLSIYYYPDHMLKDQLFRQTLALARLSYVDAAIQNLDKATRKKYRDKLDNEYRAAWWSPEMLWDQLPSLIDGIINPMYTETPYFADNAS